MKCERIRELMSAYIDNEINEVDKAKFEKHIAQCPRCKEEYELLLDIVNECSDIDEVELPEDFREELHHKLLQAKEGKSRGLSDFIRRNRWKTFAGTAAAAVLVFALSFSYLNAPKPDGEMAQSTAPNLGMLKGAEGKQKDNYNITTTDTAAPPQQNVGIAALPVEPSRAPVVTTVPEGDIRRNGIISFSEKITAQKDTNVNPSLTFGMPAPETARKIVKNGNVYLKVTDVQSRINELTAMAEQLGGIVESSYVQDIVEPGVEPVQTGDAANKTTTKVGSITIKVPAEKFESTFQGILAMGTVVNQSTNTNDITKQYMDMESRLNNLKLQEKTYQDLLSKAQNVEEILKVETELNRIRTDIDIMIGDLKRWDEQVEYSTIFINLTEVKEAELEKVDTSSVWHRARQGLINTINNIKNGIAWLFVFIISALPYILILGAGSVLAIYWIRKRKK